MDHARTDGNADHRLTVRAGVNGGLTRLWEAQPGAHVMRTRSGHHHEYVGRAWRSVYALCWGIVLVLGIAMVFVPVSNDASVVRALGVVIAVAACWFLVRLPGWTTLDLAGDTIVIRGLFRTSRLSVADIEKFVIVKGADEHEEPSSALAVFMRTGGVTVFPDFSSQHEGKLSVVKLVDELNGWLTE